MIRSYSTATTTSCLIAVLVMISLTRTSAQEPQNLQRIVKRATVATSMTGSVNEIIVGNFGRKNDILTGGSSGARLVPNTGGTPSTFGAAQVVSAGKIESLGIGDLNGDGLDDFVYAMDGSNAALRVGLQNSAGDSFAMYTVMSASGGPSTMSRAIGRSVKVDDIDGDGKNDIVATINGADGDARKGALVYLRNTGDGRTFETTYLAQDVGGIGLLQIMDLDGDSRLDIVVMGVDSKKLTVYFNEAIGVGNFTKVVLDDAVESNLCISTGDFNNVGQGDILAIGKTSIHFYLNYYQRNFEKWNMFNYGANETGSSSDYHHFACALYDIDGNGLTDIVYTQGLKDGVFFIPQTKADPSTFSGPGRTAAVAPQTSQFKLHDMNGDGIKDIVLYSQGDQAVYAFNVQELQENQYCMI